MTSEENKLNQLGLDERDLLQYLVETSKINLDTTLAEIENMEKKTILEQHPYAITHMQTKKGDFYGTYLPDFDKTGKRIFRKRKTLKELEDSGAKTVNMTFKRGEKTGELKIDPGKAKSVLLVNGTFASYFFSGSLKAIQKPLVELNAVSDYNDQHYLKLSEIESVTYGRKTYFTKGENK